MKSLFIWCVIVIGSVLLALMLWPEPDETPAPTVAAIADGTASNATSRGTGAVRSRPDVRTRRTSSERPPRTRALDIRVLDYIEQALAMSDKEERGATLRAVGELLWNQQDIDSALAHWKSMGNDSNAREFLYGVLSRWMEIDTAAATDWTRSLMAKEGVSNAVKTRALAGVTDAWAKSDPATAASWLAKLNRPSADGALAELLKGWAATDARSAAKWTARALVTKKGHSRLTLASSVASTWAATDPMSALEWMNGLPLSSRQRRSALSSFVWSWGQADPVSALAYLDRLPADDSLQNSKHQVVIHLARTDLDAALQAVAQVPDRLRDQTLIAIANDCASSHPETALQCLQAVIPSSYMSKTAGSLAAQLVDTEPEIASQIMALVPDQFRETAEQAVIQYWCKKDPAEASTWALAQEPALRKKALKQALPQWMKSDPDAATEFVNELDDDALDPEVRRATVNAYALHVAATDMSQLPAVIVDAGDLLSRSTVKQLAPKWTAADPLAAATWAVSLENLTLRRAAIGAVVKEWKSKDARAAKAWTDNLKDERDRKHAARHL